MTRSSDELAAEVARRLDAIAADPARRKPYDLDDDGRLDASERELLATILHSEIAREWDQPVAEPTRLNDRYRLVRQVGAGAQGALHIALDEVSQQFVAVKIASVAGAKDWKSLELFEREAQTIRQLDHPNIPRYLDYFCDETSDTTRLVLVREYVHGSSLEELLTTDGRLQPDALRSLIQQTLQTLSHLHGMSPPIVHRDIKPGNILRRTNGAWVLLDFGAVQAIVPDDVGGSTVVGTSGYMPPEQLMGRARPSSDLYALGATIIRVLTGRAPSELPVERMRLSWRSFAEVDDGLAAFVDRMVAPAIEDRFPNAQSALSSYRELILRQQSSANALVHGAGEDESAAMAFHTSALAPPPDTTITRDTAAPAGSFISLRETDDELEIRIPSRPGIGMILVIVGIVLALIAVAVAIISQVPVLYVGVPVALYLVYLGAESAYESSLLKFDRQQYRLERQTLLRTQKKEGDLSEMKESGVYLVGSRDNREHLFLMKFADGGQQIISKGCDLPEARWCAARINLFAERVRDA